MLKAHDLTFTVDGRRLLDEVAVTFAPGAVSMIVGANGAGKSTLIRALCRQVRPERGAVFYGDRALDSWRDSELARVRAVLSQNLELPFPLRVEEVVLMGRYPHFTGAPTAHDLEVCREAMRYFEVSAWATRSYLTLSGGERQRVHFARVMAQIWEPPPAGARYLLLDEPLTFLDIRHQFEFLQHVRALAHGNELVVVGVVHDLNLAARYADHVVVMHEGRVLAAGAPVAVLTPDRIEQAFGIRPTVHHDTHGLHLLFT